MRTYLPMFARWSDKHIICPDTRICVTLNSVFFFFFFFFFFWGGGGGDEGVGGRVLLGARCKKGKPYHVILYLMHLF